MESNKRILVMFKITLLVIAFSMASCGSTNTSQGATAGLIVGGLVDGWEGAATGALIGGGVGLMADSAEDKQIRQAQKERELSIMHKSQEQEEKEIVKKQVKTVQNSSNTNALTGRSWKVVSLVDDGNKKIQFSSIILSFQTDTKATTQVLWKDGKSETFGETYTLVDDAIIFTGKEYVTNAKYKINGKQLILVSPKMRVVLEEV